MRTAGRPGQGRLRPAALTAMICAAGTLAVSACGPAAASRPASRPASRSGGQAAAGSAGRPAQCRPAALRVRVATAQAGAAAGSTYLPLEVTNASGARCWLSGYPAVAFATAAGRQIGRGAAPDHAVRGRVVVLAPGGLAHAWLQVAAAGNYPASACHPVTAPGLRVTLAPGAPRFVAHPLPACAAAGAGALLAIEPVQPGAPRRGTAG